MRVLEEPGFVLHARAFRESSQILEVLTRDFGRVGLVARGARSGKSRWKHLLEPFRPLLLGWSQKGELGTLSTAEEAASFPQLRGEALLCGLYANELLIRFLQRSDPHPEVFSQYRELIASLCGGAPTRPSLRVFERDILGAVGLGMELDFEHGGVHEIREDLKYEYLPESGPVRRKQEADAAEPLVSGKALIALRTGQITGAEDKELKLLMRRLIRYHLGGKPLSAYKLFR